MASGFTAQLPSDVVLDAGVLSDDDVVFAVSRGGLTSSLETEWRNVEFDNKRAPVAGLDRKLSIVARFSGTFLTLSAADLARYEAQGSAPGFAYSLSQAQAYALAQAAAYGYASSAVATRRYSPGQYLTNLRVRYARGDGGTVAVLHPLAVCTEWRLATQDKNEGEVIATFEARLDLSSSADTDALPYRIEITPAA